MKVQRIQTGATTIFCRAEWFPRTRMRLARWLINLGLKVGRISFLEDGFPTRADKRRRQLKRI